MRVYPPDGNNKARLLEVGLPGRLINSGNIEEVLPLDDADLLERAKPVTPVGKVRLDPARLKARHVPAAMGDSLSHMKRKKLAEVMTDLSRRMKEFREQDGEEIDTQALFDTFLNGPGGSELHLSIWGSQRTVYGAVYSPARCLRQ